MLRYQVRISKKKAIQKISDHAMYGKHAISPRPISTSEVQNYFVRKGVNTGKLAEKCRDTKQIVPDFENRAGSTWQFSGSGKASLIDSDGDVVFEMKRPGLFIWSEYESHFEAACAARDRAVAEISYSAFQECLSQGFASLESFLNTSAGVWNKKHPEDQLSDSIDHKLSLEEKIDGWMPKISSGGKIKKGNKVWHHFKKLKELRDKNAIHPKSPGQGVEYLVFADQINAFRLGIAQLLGNLHRLVGMPVPSAIINAIHTPAVEVTTTSASVD